MRARLKQVDNGYRLTRSTSTGATRPDPTAEAILFIRRHGVGRDRQLTIAAVEEPELLSLPDNDDGDQDFRDRSIGLPLNHEMSKKAGELEMQYMEELKVLEDSDRDACTAETGRQPIPTDWVDINKMLKCAMCKKQST